MDKTTIKKLDDKEYENYIKKMMETENLPNGEDKSDE